MAVDHRNGAADVDFLKSQMSVHRICLDSCVLAYGHSLGANFATVSMQQTLIKLSL